MGTPKMNFFPAELLLLGGEYAVRAAGVDHVLSGGKQKILRQRNEAPRKVILGIRPEHVRITAADARGSIQARVDVSEMMGSEIYLHVVVDELDVIIRVPTEDMKNNSFKPGKNNTVHFIIPEPLIHLFDTDTEKNLLA